MAVSLDQHDHIAVLTLQRPPVNALDLAMLRAIEQAAGDLARAAPIGLVITGAGDAFCAGVDVRSFAACSPRDRAETVLTINRMLFALYALPFPVVSAVSGHAAGGGFVLMLTGDVRIATKAQSARHGLQEAKAGIPFPSGALEVIRAELPPELLRSLALTSRGVTTEEMHRCGMIDELQPPEALIPTALQAVRMLAAQPGFEAVKGQVRRPLRERLERIAESGEDELARRLLAAGEGVPSRRAVDAHILVARQDPKA